jgi:hypothetical protein
MDALRRPILDIAVGLASTALALVVFLLVAHPSVLQETLAPPAAPSICSGRRDPRGAGARLAALRRAAGASSVRTVADSAARLDK